MPQPHSASTATVRPGSRGVRNIGEVLTELHEDFPRITASKIRFLEEKGLISPQRTAAGYRKYTAADIERLRFILALQRDQYLPLKVIKDYLDAIDRGERPDALPDGVTVAPRGLTDNLAGELKAHSRSLTLKELMAETGASEDLLTDLRAYGLIADDNGKYNEHALKVTRSCVQLRNHGIEPRHLRPFRAAADREVGLVERVVAPMVSRRDVSSRAQAAETAREISDLCLGLHSALVQGQISRMDT